MDAPSFGAHTQAEGMTSASVWASYVSRLLRKAPLLQSLLPSASECACLCAEGHAELLAHFILQQFEGILRYVHVKAFWSSIGTLEGYNMADPEAEYLLLTTIKDLCKVVEEQCYSLQQLTHQLASYCGASKPALVASLLQLPLSYRTSVSATLLADATASLSDVLHSYYSAKLEDMRRVLGEHEELEGNAGHVNDENEDPCEGAQQNAVSAAEVMGSSWSNNLLGIVRGLQILNLEAVSQEAYTSVIHNYVHDRLAECSRGVFDQEVLTIAKGGVTSVPFAFLKLTLSADPLDEVSVSSTLHNWQLRLTYYVYETLGSLRIQEMFDIVIDYPDSLPAIRDVCECLRHTNLHMQFVSVFKDTVQQRLLHAGAATSDIIHQYVATIKALREIDPSGMLLTAVGGPIKQYLRGRSDTIRCIVGMLTEDPQDGGESLLEELEGSLTEDVTSSKEGDGDVAALKAVECAGGGSDPTGLGIGRGLAESNNHDIVSMLIGIYGSKELFSTEYQCMLADRLLSKNDYDCTRELRTLELLKMRFGEGSLNRCEVMLKDLADSKRLNSNIHNLPPLPASPTTPSANSGQAGMEAASSEPEPALKLLDATVVSYLFWPELQEAEMKLPGVVQRITKLYAARYHNIKSPRKLQWKPTLGVVELEVAVGDTIVHFRVSPVHATILSYFNDHEQADVATLAATINVPQAVVRHKALFWVNNGVLLESRTDNGDIIYQRASHWDADQATNTVISDMHWDEDVAVSVSTEEEALIKEMAVYENYISGIITNFPDGLSLERIHNTLRLFVLQPPYDKSQDQLAHYLQLMMSQDKITFDAGVYKSKPRK